MTRAVTKQISGPLQCLAACLVVWGAIETQAARGADGAAATSPPGIVPTGVDGKPLHLDFESGDLTGWVAEGEAFAKQPVEGDTVHARRGDMHSRHTGKYWVGTYERGGDAPQGTLTSAPFKVTHPFASFLVAGGRTPATRVELVRRDNQQVIAKATGDDTEQLRAAVIDLTPHQGAEIFVRLVDNSSTGWGHVNFDDFRLHAQRPVFPPDQQALTQDVYVHDGLTPAEAAQAMTLPEGFSVKLFAGEPDVQQPIAMAIDDRGRLWIAEAYNYPWRVKPEQAKDRILIFEDTDGDGDFDTRKVFAEKLNLVSGIELGFGGVWVGAAPELLFIPDRDHDDQPDGPPEVLLDGWGFQDTHETLNTFNWGPDGWLYGCHGVFTHSRVGKPGARDKERTPLNAGIWRYHPTRHEFEVFIEGTSNPWGVDFNDYGDAFLTSCVIPHLFHLCPGARYHRQAGKHFNPFTYDDIKTVADHVHWVGERPHAGNDRSDAAGGGHAHSGCMIYLGGAWPEKYRGQIFMNNIHGARINQDILEPQGSGYVAHHGPDFLLANDRWSQILNLRYGPDGQAYMIDWYDKNQCHRLETEIHDRSNGRIFKIVYGETKHTPVDMAARSDAELAVLMLEKNDWYVRHARRQLQERAAAGKLAPSVATTLWEMACSHADETRRLRGLWALHVIGAFDDDRARELLGSDMPHVRAWTIRLLAEKAGRAETFEAQLAKLAQADSSQVVRRELASAANKISVGRRAGILRGLVAHSEDVGDHNLPLMYWYALEPIIGRNSAEALAIARSSQIPLLLTYTVRKIGAEGNAEALDLLVTALADMTDPAQQQNCLDGINLALRGRRRVAMPSGWPAVAAKLSASPSEPIRAAARALAVTFGDPEALAAMRGVLSDKSQDLAARQAALESLLAAKDEKLAPTLQGLLTDEALRGPVLRGLAAYDDGQTPAAILAVYARLGSAEKRDALNTLAARSSYANALLDAIAAKQIATGDVSADVIRQLRNLKDEELLKRVSSVWGTVRDSSRDVANRIKDFKKMLTTAPPEPVDLALGRAMFAKTCQQCHTLFGQGGKVGPELTGSNRADLDYLLSNVLDPSALMAKDYMPTVISTTDGRILTGIVREEDANSLTLQTANEVLQVPLAEIDERQASEKSMMPDDIFQPLKEHEIRSLVAYLASPAQTPLLATADTVVAFFNGRDLTGWTGDTKLWSVENGEIVGRTQGLLHNEFLISDLLAGDFLLKLEVKLVDNRGNSGVQFRSKPIADGDKPLEVQGYQADIGPGWWGKLYEEHGRALLWNKSGESHLKPGDWNEYEIVAVGDRIQTFLNGQKCVDLDDPPGAKRGIFALQLHSGGKTEVRYRNFKLELLPAQEQQAAK
ncbi:MAG: DUF1080 domain-containing protein [Planctomycetaceae bacterium]|nr:DUF1080 domain-containing protein [Planctomycetaceae bacterium]